MFNLALLRMCCGRGTARAPFRSEFRVYAAKGGEVSEPPEGGTPNGA